MIPPSPPSTLEAELRQALQPGKRGYHTIAHLPGSRVGPSDRHLSLGQAALCTERLKDGRDRVVVLEKLDGTCVAAVRLGEQVVAIGRQGHRADRSLFLGRRHFAAWVQLHHHALRALLADGERVVGEWLSVAHGTRYALPHEPFVAFDLIRGERRAGWDEVVRRCTAVQIPTAATLHAGSPCSIEAALERLGPHGLHGALDEAEGLIWRVERHLKGHTRVHTVAKYVRATHTTGRYLADVTGQDDRINTWPGSTETLAMLNRMAERGVS
ncbi:MAG: RNA ligase family protein [Myxococcota bacterium]